jgi:hypothetical protein
MSEHPDYQPHRRYTVTFRSLSGATKSRRVLTNRGEAKAVYLASLATGGSLFRRFGALEVEVHDDGPPELEAMECRSCVATQSTETSGKPRGPNALI